MKRARRAGGRRLKARRGRKKAGYVELWFLRARVARRLSMAGKRLNVKNCTVARLARILPDSYCWMVKFCKTQGWDPKITQVEKLFKAMDYIGMGQIR